MVERDEARGGKSPAILYHYSNRRGYNGIVANRDWLFRATRPPATWHPLGAYFTTLPPQTPQLASRLRVPREKLAFFLSFEDAGDLRELPGGRGGFIRYSPADYLVMQARQRDHGAST